MLDEGMCVNGLSFYIEINFMYANVSIEHLVV